MTVMPGFIDAHRHIIQGDPAQWMSSLAKERMQEFLDAGFTTVLSCGDALDQILDLRGKLKSGEIQGPTLYAAAFMQLARPTPPTPGAPRVDPARTDVSRPPDRPTKAAAGIPAAETLDTVQKLAKAGIDAFKAVITVTPGGPEKATLSLIVTGSPQARPALDHPRRHLSSIHSPPSKPRPTSWSIRRTSANSPPPRSRPSPIRASP